MQLEKLRYSDYTALINLSRGANCVSLRNTKYNARILREPPYLEKAEQGHCPGDTEELDNPYLYGMPILFPVNRISGGTFEFEGRTYTFPINESATGCHLHGELHRTAFALVERTESKLVCVYRADGEHPYLSFPHAFEIRMEYELDDSGMTHRVRVTNHSQENMPCFLGFHTTFNLNIADEAKAVSAEAMWADVIGTEMVSAEVISAETLSAEAISAETLSAEVISADAMSVKEVRAKVEISEEYERNMKNYLPTGRKPAFDAVSSALAEGRFDPYQVPISRHYRAKNGGVMELYDVQNDLRVVYENDEKYGFRLIYNGNADEYICLEPNTCLANCANAPVSREEAGFDYIEPGRSKEYVSRIYIVEGGGLSRKA